LWAQIEGPRKSRVLKTAHQGIHMRRVVKGKEAPKKPKVVRVLQPTKPKKMKQAPIAGYL